LNLGFLGGDEEIGVWAMEMGSKIGISQIFVTAFPRDSMEIKVVAELMKRSLNAESCLSSCWS